MTRLLYLPDDATVIQLEIDLSPAELVAAVNAGLRPLPILRSAPVRQPGRPRRAAERTDLTRRQRQVLELSSRGFTSAEIAGMLDLSRRAVNYHLSQVRKRIRGELPALPASDPNDPTDLL